MEDKNKAVAVVVEREGILACVFPAEEVILNDEDVKKRARKIHRATSLGNLEHQKVTVFFEDEVGLKRINTTIWAQTGSKIVLKDNIHLPVHRIVDIVI